MQGVLDRALQGEETANFEFPLITKSDRRVEVLLNATTRRDGAGNILGVVGIGQDITMRKAAEIKLSEVAQDLTTLIDTANAPIFGIDALGRVTEWNKKASEITEFSYAETIGKNLVEEFIRPEYRDVVQEVLDAALNKGIATANFEFPLWTKSGQRLQVLLNANPRRNAKNEIVGVVGVGQDITSRLVQEQEYVRLIELANAPIFGVDMDGNVNVGIRLVLFVFFSSFLPFFLFFPSSFLPFLPFLPFFLSSSLLLFLLHSHTTHIQQQSMMKANLPFLFSRFSF